MKFSDTTKILSIVFLLAGAITGCRHDATPGKASMDANNASASGASLVGPVWKLVAVQRPGDAEEAIKPEPPYTIQFGADGRFSGQAHCNRHMGRYELLPSGGVKLDAGASTLAMCLGDSIASEFLKALGTSTRYKLSDGKLILSSDGGTVLTFGR